MSKLKHPLEEKPRPLEKRTLIPSNTEVGTAVQIPIQGPGTDGTFTASTFSVAEDWVVTLTSHGQLIFPESYLVRIEGDNELDTAVYQTDDENSVWISQIKWSKTPRTVRIKMDRPSSKVIAESPQPSTQTGSSETTVAVVSDSADFPFTGPDAAGRFNPLTTEVSFGPSQSLELKIERNGSLSFGTNTVTVEISGQGFTSKQLTSHANSYLPLADVLKDFWKSPAQTFSLKIFWPN
jgi:hypothetical protein